jgi:putative addiction module component (TIGR02574 family)
MAMNDEQLEAEIMKLGLDARARLAEKLILSLDAPSDEENLGLWVAEAERRLRDLREGRAKEIPAEEVFRRARQAIS